MGAKRLRTTPPTPFLPNGRVLWEAEQEAAILLVPALHTHRSSRLPTQAPSLSRFPRHPSLLPSSIACSTKSASLSGSFCVIGLMWNHGAAERAETTYRWLGHEPTVHPYRWRHCTSWGYQGDWSWPSPAPILDTFSIDVTVLNPLYDPQRICTFVYLPLSFHFHYRHLRFLLSHQLAIFSNRYMDSWRLVVLGDGGVGNTALAVQVSTPPSISACRVWQSLVYAQLLCWFVIVCLLTASYAYHDLSHLINRGASHFSINKLILSDSIVCRLTTPR